MLFQQMNLLGFSVGLSQATVARVRLFLAGMR
jgi:hypothetical protein